MQLDTQLFDLEYRLHICISMKNKETLCVVCGNKFQKKANNQKLCSDQCKSDFGALKEKLRYKKSKESSRRSSVCKHCGDVFEYHYRSERGERTFCSRSCASKFYIKNGNFDSWKLRSNPKAGAMLKCLNPSCSNMVYHEPRLVKSGTGKVCSFACEKEYFSKLFSGKNNPFFGKTMTDEQKSKQKQTLQKNHPGVVNAFSLAKKRTKSRPQIKIFEHLCQEYPQHNFLIEKRLLIEDDKELYADIISFDKKIVIEFNGDYWHCNPERYESTFFHHVKKQHASEIWESDKKRLDTIKCAGYRIHVIWEKEFRANAWKSDLRSFVEEHDKENNIDAFRPSVNNYSSADVKLGELLESRGTSTTTGLETMNVKVEKLELNDNQQPSSCEETLEKVQRLRLA